MNESKKKLSLLMLTASLTMSGVIVSLLYDANFTPYDAYAEHIHSGNHYNYVEATFNTPGSKEYWVCCNCHELFINDTYTSNNKPASGTWLDQGNPTEVFSSSDARYIEKGHLKNGIVLSADGTRISSYTPVEGITDIIVPNTVTRISNEFAGSNITSIIIPGSVDTVEAEAFLRCKSLKHVTLQPGVKRLVNTSGKGPFTYCSALEWVIIPDTVYQVDNYVCREASDASDLTFYCEAPKYPGISGKNKYGDGNDWAASWALRAPLGKKYNIVWGLGSGWKYADDGVTPIKL
mgnify:CR=1 FL=1